MTGDPLQKLTASRDRAGNDNKFAADNRSLLTDMVMGMRFYSRYPLPGLPHEVPNLNRMAPAIGFASVVIALGPALLMLLLSAFGLPPMVVAGLGVGAYVLASGAMSEDALADSADGLFGGKSIVTRLAILEDSRHGTYGVTALIVFLLVRVGALAGAIAVSPLAAACIWIGATTLSRSAAIWLTMALPPARGEGNGATVGRVGLVPFAAGLGISILIAFLLAAPFVGLWGIILVLILGGLISIGWRLLCGHLLGGQTGDLIGALQALLEIAALSVFVAALG